MQSSAVLSCRTGEASPAESCLRRKANREQRARPAEVDSRTRMLLENPIAKLGMRVISFSSLHTAKKTTLRMRDVRLRVKFLLCVYSALNLG